ncbi:MAG: hypothetical protein ACJA0I_000515 [Gammaproteobacteria bacterium]|jgi:hypothetical protein
MLEPKLSITILFLLLISLKTEGRNAEAIWDSRCEECHGDNTKFARRYLWNVGGELQAQHHVDNLSLFMRQHYIPNHEIETIRKMLLEQANSPLRFRDECSVCHGDVTEFVKKSIWVRGNEVTGRESGKDLREFLPGHQKLQPKEASFFLRLFARVAGKPFYVEEPLLQAITR